MFLRQTYKCWLTAHIHVGVIDYIYSYDTMMSRNEPWFICSTAKCQWNNTETDWLTCDLLCRCKSYLDIWYMVYNRMISLVRTEMTFFVITERFKYGKRYHCVPVSNSRYWYQNQWVWTPDLFWHLVKIWAGSHVVSDGNQLVKQAVELTK